MGHGSLLAIDRVRAKIAEELGTLTANEAIELARELRDLSESIDAAARNEKRCHGGTAIMSAKKI